MNSADPRDYLKSLTERDKLVYKYEGGEIHFRTFLTTEEVEDIRPEFYDNEVEAQSMILFQALAMLPDGRQMFPRPTGEENKAARKQVDDAFAKYNGTAIAEICREVGLWKRIVPVLKGLQMELAKAAGPKEKEKSEDETKDSES